MSFGYGIQQFGIDTTLPVLQNLVVWLDAADENTITIATGISQWDDKSGNGNNFTQTTGGDQPAYVTEVQNGLNVARFDGATEFIDAAAGVLISGTTARTFFIVTQYTEDSANQGFFTMNVVPSPSPGERYQFVRGNGNLLQLQVSGGNIIYTAALPASWTVYSCRNAASSNINATDGRADGADMGVSSSISRAINTKDEGASSLGLNGNGANFLTGDIGEFILYDRDLSDSETESMENYLLAKWGIAHA